MVVCEHDTPDVDCDEFPDIIAANRDLTDEEIAEIEEQISNELIY